MAPLFNDFIPQKRSSQVNDLNEELMGEIGKILQAAVINRNFRNNLSK